MCGRKTVTVSTLFSVGLGNTLTSWLCRQAMIWGLQGWFNTMPYGNLIGNVPISREAHLALTSLSTVENIGPN
jgi:hypothetical protein